MSKFTLKKNVYLEFTILFVIVGLFVLFWFYLFKRTFVMQSDGFTQQYPIVVHLRHSLGELVRGNGLSLWNWSTGLGADKIGNFYSIYFDPFTYVMASFPPAKMDIGYTLAIYLRLYAAGLTMLIYLRSIKQERYQCLVGALSYCYCMWSFIAYGQMTFFIPMIVFPLLIMAIDEIDRSGKPYMLILTVAYLLGTTPYFAFMMAIISGIYSIVRYFYTDREKSVVDFLKRFGVLVGSIGLACLIVAPILSITILTLAHTPKGGESYTPDLFYKLKQAMLLIPSFFTDQQFMGNYSAMSICGIMPAMVPALVLNLRFKKSPQARLLSVMFFMCMVFLAFPIFGSIMNGMNYTQARWAFMLQFFFCASVCETLSDKGFEERNYQVAFARGFVILIFVVGFLFGTCTFFKLFSNYNLGLAMINIAAMMVTVVIMLISPEKEGFFNRRRKLVFLCVFNLCATYFMKFSNMIDGGQSDRMPLGLTNNIYQRSILKDADSFDDDFYRIDINNHVNGYTTTGYADFYHYLANDSMYYNTPTTYSYVSTIDACLFEYNKLLCNNDGTNMRVECFSNDGRSRMDFLQNVQYIAVTPNDQNEVRNYAYSVVPELSNENRVILKNRWDVSLGYVYPEFITESEYLAQDYLARQQTLFQAAVVSDDYAGTAAHKPLASLTNDTKELEYQIENADSVTIEGNRLKAGKSNATMTLRFEDIENCELYVFLDEFNRIPVTYEDLKKQKITKDSTIQDKARFVYQYLLYQPSEGFEFFVSKSSRQEKILDYTGQNNQAVVEIADYLRNIGYYSEAEGTVSLRFGTAATYSLDSLKVYTVSAEHFDEQADRLIRNRLSVSEVGNDYIKGSVDSEGGILYLSILDSGGWKAYVDGKKTDLRTVNVAFIGLDVEPGYHEIELRYSPTGWPVAWIFTVIGVAGFAGVVVFFRIQGKKKTQPAETSESDEEKAKEAT